MRKLIKIISLFLLIMLLFQTISHAALPYQNHIVAYARKFVEEGNDRDLLVYSQNYGQKAKGRKLELSSGYQESYGGELGSYFENKLAYDCGSFVATMYYQAFNHEINIGMPSTSDYVSMRRRRSQKLF